MSQRIGALVLACLTLTAAQTSGSQPPAVRRGVRAYRLTDGEETNS
jgi:hypothetical protein